MITISSQAEKRLRELLGENPELLPRIHFVEAGIGMPELKLILVKEVATDLVQEAQGIPFIIDEDVSYFSPHLVIDLVPEQPGEFRVIPRGDDGCDGDCGRCSGCPEP